MANARVKKSVQEQVDEYIDLHKHISELNVHLKRLRKEIEPYMQEKKLDEIEGSEGGKVYFQPSERVAVNARFTTYDTLGLAGVLSYEHYNQCIKEVIDADQLEILIKDKQVSRSVANQFKVTTKGYSFKADYK